MSGLPSPPQSSTSRLTPSSTVTNRTLCGEQSVCAATFRETTSVAIKTKYKFFILRTRLSRNDDRYQLPHYKENGYGKTRLRSEEHTSELQSLRHLVCRL